MDVFDSTFLPCQQAIIKITVASRPSQDGPELATPRALPSEGGPRVLSVQCFRFYVLQYTPGWSA